MAEPQRMSGKKPQCYMAMLYLNWVVYLGVIAWGGLTGRYFFSLVWALGYPAFLLAYMNVFPRISRLVGYGSVEDQPAIVSREAGDAERSQPSKPEVTLYKAVGCPFCPIVEERLDRLEQEGAFALHKVDVTLRPGILAAKRIKAVPVVEVGEQRLTGNATSRQLADLLERARWAGGKPTALA